MDEALDRADSSVVDQDVDVVDAVYGPDVIRGALDGSGVRHVTSVGRHDDRLGPAHPGRLLDRRLVDVEQSEMATLGSEGTGEFPSDSRPRSGDDRQSAREVLHEANLEEEGRAGPHQRI